MVAWRVNYGAKDLIKFAVWNVYELLGKDRDQLLHEGELKYELWVHFDWYELKLVRG